MSSSRDSRSHPYRAHRPVSDKEELARAALRSLADPSTAPPPPPPNDSALRPPPALVAAPSFPATRLPAPLASNPATAQQPASSSSSSASATAAPPTASHPLDDEYRRPHRPDYADEGMHLTSPSSSASHHASRNAVLRDAHAMQRNASASSSFFHDQHFTTSPDSSPRLEAASLPSHPHLRHSILSSTYPATSAHIHELALRRASIAMGVDIDEVRHIVQHALASRRTSAQSSAASASSQAAYHPPSHALADEPRFVRQVLDAYCLESDRASQPQPLRDPRTLDLARSDPRTHADSTDPAPTGIAWNSANRSTERTSHRYPASHAERISWTPRGSSFDENLPAYGSRYASRPAYPSYHDPSRPDPLPFGSTIAAMMPIQERRAESPSPFAYDAYRRISQPASSDADLGASSSSHPLNRSSQAYLDEPARQRAFDEERLGALRPRYPISAYPPHPPPLPQTRAPDRRVRSIDDYLDAPYLHPARRQQRRGSVAEHNGRPAMLAPEYDDDRFRDRHFRHAARHSIHPYRYNGASADPVGISPQLSPTMADAPRPHHLFDHRSPLLRSPAETATSIAGSSVAALSPSPLLSVPGRLSAGGTPDDRKRSEDLNADEPSTLRSASEDTVAESTRDGVARMQIDDASASFRAPLKSSSARTSRSSLGSLSSAERAVPGTDLSHSQIMQKLQDKVKRRLAAKKVAAAGATESAAKTGSGDKKGIKGKKSVKHKDSPIANVASSLGFRSSAPKHGGSSKSDHANTEVSKAGVVKTESSKPEAFNVGVSKSEKVSRTGSTKRTASSISTSDRTASSQERRRSHEASHGAATAEVSATPAGSGMPAPKVRRTSASSQQKPTAPSPKLAAPKPAGAQLTVSRPVSQSQSPAPKPASPLGKDRSPPATIEEALRAVDSKSPAPKSASPVCKNGSTPRSIEAALLSPTDSPTPTEAAALHAQRMSKSPLPGQDGVATVETASGQALPGELPGAGQMNASSATKQQTSMAGMDSLLQAAQANDPTETNSAIA